MKCEYCETQVFFETDNPNDRQKLMDKQSLMSNVYVNGNELLNVEYYLGYFSIKDRCEINHCPVCGRKFEEEREAE